MVAVLLLAVSYGREVAPLLAMRCSGCHGEAGGFSTKTHASVMAGGNLGRAVIPGRPDESVLVHFIEGRRGPQRRMPIGGRAFTAAEIGTIRNWILEGASDDRVSLPVHRKQVTAVPLGEAAVVRVRVTTECLLTMRVRDDTGKVWLERTATVKAEPEEADAGKPGDWVEWTVRSGDGWPASVDIEVTLQYSAGEPGAWELDVSPRHR